MVFGGNDVHTGLVFIVVLFQQTLGSGTRSGHHRFAFQIGKVFNASGFVYQQTGADYEEVVGELNLFLALKVVGGGAAFKVDGAVYHQRDAVLRSHQVIAHFQIRHIEFFFHRFHYFHLQVVCITNRLIGVVGNIRERNRSIAVTQYNGAGSFDFFQRALGFGSRSRTAGRSRRVFVTAAASSQAKSHQTGKTQRFQSVQIHIQ